MTDLTDSVRDTEPPPHLDGDLGDPMPVPEPPGDRALAIPVERLTPGTQGLAGEGELRRLAQLAVTLSAGSLVPKALFKRPADVLLVLLTARELGIAETLALRECHPIDGRVTISPKLKLALFRSSGLGRIWPHGPRIDPDTGEVRACLCGKDGENDDTAATWHGIRNDDPTTVYTSTFTMFEARQAGLDGKDNWRKYPARMVSHRAVGYLIDDAFGEVSTGMYAPDELGAVTDEDGRIVVDVTEVGGLPGMDRTAPAVELADDAVRAGLGGRIKALPADLRDDLKAVWVDKITAPLAKLPKAEAAKAEALVDFFEKKAAVEADGLPAEPEFDVDPDPADSPAEASEAEPVAETAEDAPEAATGDPGAVSGDVGEAPDVADPLDALIAEVKAMAVMTVRAQLRSFGLDDSGKREDLQRRLCEHLAFVRGIEPDA